MPASNSAVATDKQIAQYAANAGWSGNDLVISVAVALAESGGRVAVVNYLGCTGLWQVYAKVHGLSIEKLKDPQYNAQQAYKIWKSQGWKRGWTTYSHGTYQKYMSRAKKAVEGIKPGSTGGLPDSGFSADATSLGAIDAAMDKLLSRQTWINILLVIIGIILLLIALSRMSMNDDKIKIAKAALQFVPGGGAAVKGLKAVSNPSVSGAVAAAKGMGKAATPK